MTAVRYRWNSLTAFGEKTSIRKRPILGSSKVSSVERLAAVTP
jgi:hypothetical protein